MRSQTVLGAGPSLSVAGRTDAGVHALGAGGELRVDGDAEPEPERCCAR